MVCFSKFKVLQKAVNKIFPNLKWRQMWKFVFPWKISIPSWMWCWVLAHTWDVCWMWQQSCRWQTWCMSAGQTWERCHYSAVHSYCLYGSHSLAPTSHASPHTDTQESNHYVNTYYNVMTDFLLLSFCIFRHISLQCPYNSNEISLGSNYYPFVDFVTDIQFLTTFNNL